MDRRRLQPGRLRLADRSADRRGPDRPVHDTESRHAHKTVARRQDGFKAHLVIEPDTGIVTACGLTKTWSHNVLTFARRRKLIRVMARVSSGLRVRSVRS